MSRMDFAHGRAVARLVVALLVATLVAGTTAAAPAAQPAKPTNGEAAKAKAKAKAKGKAKAKRKKPATCRTAKSKSKSKAKTKTKAKRRSAAHARPAQAACRAKKKKKKKKTAPPVTTPAPAPPASPVTRAPSTSTADTAPAPPAVGEPGPTGPSQTALRVRSPEDVLQLGSRMVFSTVANQSRPGRSLTLENTADSALSVASLSFAGPQAQDFELCAGQQSSFTIPARATRDVCVAYRPKVDAVSAGTRVSQGTLSIQLGNVAGPPVVVTLGGLNARGYEGTNEPSVQNIFDALGYRNDAAVINQPFLWALGPSSLPVGDEVLSAYWKRLDPGKPVTLLPVARYGGLAGGANSSAIGWYPKGSSTRSYLYALPGGNATGQQHDGYGQNQMLLPSTTAPNLTFAPSGSFGLVDSDGTRSDDALNLGAWHNLRFFPARDASGNQIPGAYLVAADPFGPVLNSAKNWDYQDFVFLLLNAQPESSASGQPTAGEMSRLLSNFTGANGGVAGTGFTSVQENAIDATKIATAGGLLRITSSNDSNTRHTNALQLGVNAGTGFRIESRFVGPLTAIDAGSEQQGIYWGPSATEYLKAEVDWSAADNARMLTIWLQNGASGEIVDRIPLPGGDASSVDLRIQVDPSPQSPYDGEPFATVSYALNGGAYVALNTSRIPIPTGWITANTPAGIIASHQEGGSPFTASFASFAVSRSYW